MLFHLLETERTNEAAVLWHMMEGPIVKNELEPRQGHEKLLWHRIVLEGDIRHAA